MEEILDRILSLFRRAPRGSAPLSFAEKREFLTGFEREVRRVERLAAEGRAHLEGLARRGREALTELRRTGAMRWPDQRRSMLFLRDELSQAK